jgi:predicted transcriptional regulator
MAKNGQVKEPVSVSLNTSVLVRLDRYCLKTDLDRSYVVNRAIKKFLACELADNPAFWDRLYDECEEEVII